jgi:asparagine synthase (glutamine-hydrolysing)
MSGICGLFNLDGAPIAEVELRAMTAMLEQRGPERTGRWRDGSVALGHTLLATTPELLLERQPFRHADTGCVITADVRIDNRDELLDALNIRDRSDSIGDAALIIATYLAWGDECPERLLGDFAFALWDPREQKLFCARDHFGMRPLYYHHAPNQRFVFASDARAILVLSQVPYEINEGRVADFLLPQLEWIDYTSTFFEDVYRLPPGHTATVTSSQFVVDEYWTPEPGPDPGPISDEEFMDGFLEVFTRAVKSRLRAPDGAAGSTLSGGVDSGAVVAIARGILAGEGKNPLPTYSAARRTDTDCEESRRIFAALSALSPTPTLVYADAIRADFERLIATNEEPFDGVFTFLKAIYLEANEQGRRVVLDGAGGDIVFSEGTYIARLIRHGKLKLAAREILAQNKYWQATSLVSDLAGYLRSALLPEVLKNRLRPLAHRRQMAGFLDGSLISKEFAARVRVEERFRRMRQNFEGGWTEDYSVERSNAILPNMTAGRERYARLAAGAGVEARDPFLDKRVVDFCTRLPGHLRLKSGWPKVMLRQLMTGRLPFDVCWSRGKPHLRWVFNAAITELAVSHGQLAVVDLSQGLDPYVDTRALNDAWHIYRDGGDAGRIHSAFLLNVWLRENANRPVVADQ